MSARYVGQIQQPRRPTFLERMNCVAVFSGLGSESSEVVVVYALSKSPEGWVQHVIAFGTQRDPMVSCRYTEHT